MTGQERTGGSLQAGCGRLWQAVRLVNQALKYRFRHINGGCYRGC